MRKPIEMQDFRATKSASKPMPPALPAQQTRNDHDVLAVNLHLGNRAETLLMLNDGAISPYALAEQLQSQADPTNNTSRATHAAVLHHICENSHRQNIVGNVSAYLKSVHLYAKMRGDGTQTTDKLIEGLHPPKTFATDTKAFRERVKKQVKAFRNKLTKQAANNRQPSRLRQMNDVRMTHLDRARSHLRKVVDLARKHTQPLPGDTKARSHPYMTRWDAFLESKAKLNPDAPSTLAQYDEALLDLALPGFKGKIEADTKQAFDKIKGQPPERNWDQDMLKNANKALEGLRNALPNKNPPSGGNAKTIKKCKDQLKEALRALAESGLTSGERSDIVQASHPASTSETTLSTAKEKQSIQTMMQDLYDYSSANFAQANHALDIHIHANDAQRTIESKRTPEQNEAIEAENRFLFHHAQREGLAEEAREAGVPNPGGSTEWDPSAVMLDSATKSLAPERKQEINRSYAELTREKDKADQSLARLAAAKSLRNPDPSPLSRYALCGEVTSGAPALQHLQDAVKLEQPKLFALVKKAQETIRGKDGKQKQAELILDEKVAFNPLEKLTQKIDDQTEALNTSAQELAEKVFQLEHEEKNGRLFLDHATLDASDSDVAGTKANVADTKADSGESKKTDGANLKQKMAQNQRDLTKLRARYETNRLALNRTLKDFLTTLDDPKINPISGKKSTKNEQNAWRRMQKALNINPGSKTNQLAALIHSVADDSDDSLFKQYEKTLPEHAKAVKADLEKLVTLSFESQFPPLSQVRDPGALLIAMGIHKLVKWATNDRVNLKRRTIKNKETGKAVVAPKAIAIKWTAQAILRGLTQRARKQFFTQKYKEYQREKQLGEGSGFSASIEGDSNNPSRASNESNTQGDSLQGSASTEAKNAKAQQSDQHESSGESESIGETTNEQAKENRKKRLASNDNQKQMQTPGTSAGGGGGVTATP